MTIPNKLYIIKQAPGTCEIIKGDRINTLPDSTIVAQWGPFNSPDEAIARRVGLIRAGKCQPQ